MEAEQVDNEDMIFFSFSVIIFTIIINHIKGSYDAKVQSWVQRLTYLTEFCYLHN